MDVPTILALIAAATGTVVLFVVGVFVGLRFGETSRGGEQNAGRRDRTCADCGRSVREGAAACGELRLLLDRPAWAAVKWSCPDGEDRRRVRTDREGRRTAEGGEEARDDPGLEV